MSDKEISVPIRSASDLDIGLCVDTTGREALVKRNAVPVVVVRVALHRDNVVAKPLSPGQDHRISIV